ncbi:hypothetical protein GGQ00_003027 [Salinibacter ruber]|nr:hypothetical protein [Salinibacter ruber]
MEAFTVVLETTEPFGPEVQAMQVKAENPNRAALRSLHHWHNREFNPRVDVADLEDGSARVLAVLKGHSEVALMRNPSQELV